MRTSRRLGNMVAVMANEQQQFESLVTQLMSPDNNVRNQAEVGKSFLLLLQSFYRFSYARNYIADRCRGWCAREVQIARHDSDGYLHAMCLFYFGGSEIFSGSYNSKQSLNSSLLLVFLTGVILSKERSVLMIFHPRFYCYYSRIFCAYRTENTSLQKMNSSGIT